MLPFSSLFSHFPTKWGCRRKFLPCTPILAFIGPKIPSPSHVTTAITYNISKLMTNKTGEKKTHHFFLALDVVMNVLVYPVLLLSPRFLTGFLQDTITHTHKIINGSTGKKEPKVGSWVVLLFFILLKCIPNRLVCVLMWQFVKSYNPCQFPLFMLFDPIFTVINSLRKVNMFIYKLKTCSGIFSFSFTIQAGLEMKISSLKTNFV